MTDDTRWARGAEWFERVYGPGTAQGLLDQQHPLARDLARLGVEFNFGDLYSRPGLDLAQRELLSLASLATLGGLEPQLRGHTRGALRVGCTAEQIVEAIMHTVQYAGFPRALNALGVVTDELVRQGAATAAP